MSASDPDHISPGRDFWRISPERVPLLKQSFVATLIILAAASSMLLPWLPVTDAAWMLTGVGIALAALGFGGAISRWPSLLRLEIVLPAADFVAVGLLRYGTGDNASLFLPIVILAVVWIAAWPGRRHVIIPLLGACVTLLLPYAIQPTGREPSELVRLVVVLVVYGTLCVAVNELARQAGLKLTAVQAQKDVVDRELDRAAAVQQSLLPPDASTLPSGFSVVGSCVPARSVGGDFFDWYPTSGGIAITVGDVMGKGVGAGMIAAAVRSLIRSAVDESNPAAALRRATVGLSTSGVEIDTQFTTCFHARIDHDGTIHWVDAGHGLAVLRRVDGTVERFRSTDLPVGLGTDWTTHTTVAGPGDTLVCVSDGVLDLFDDELTALDNFERMLQATPRAADIVRSITTLAGKEDRPDDVTIVAATFTRESDITAADATTAVIAGQRRD